MWIQIIIIALVTAITGFTNPITDGGNIGKAVMIEKMQEGYAPIVVLELFTSQGCSSCPPADALLKKMKQQSDPKVFTLSYHVDYWNYIGWKDPFSQHSFTEKQRSYNLKFGNTSIYTPQMVINGSGHFVGSDAAVLASKMASYGKISVANKVTINKLTRVSDSMRCSFVISGDLDGKNVRAVLVLDERTTVVSRGENRNRKLINSNIVVAEEWMPARKSQASLSIRLPEILLPGDGLKLVLIIEDEAHDITGATEEMVPAQAL